MRISSLMNRLIVGFGLGAVMLLSVTPASAIPAFARATGKACEACHFQKFPALNDFGADFKASAFTDLKNKPLAGKDLSLADQLYASIFTKLRYQKTNGTEGAGAKSTHSGEIQFPDEFALLFGGRVSKNIGFMVEGQLIDGEGATLAGFKMPMAWEMGAKGMKVGVVPFTTDGLGASYGFELLNTGAVRNIRVNEHRSETSAQQYVFFNGTAPGGATAGAATGLAFTLYDPLFHVAVTPFTPNHLPGAGSGLGGLGSVLVRAAVTPKVGDWSLAAGVQMYSGKNVNFEGPDQKVSTKGYAIDAQAQGAVGGMPLGVYFSHAKAPGSAAGSDSPNLFNSKAKARTATTIAAELGVMPNLTLTLAHRIANNGSASDSKDDATTFGVSYKIQQNVALSLAHSIRTKGAGGVGRYGPTDKETGQSGGNSLTTLMLSAGF